MLSSCWPTTVTTDIILLFDWLTFAIGSILVVPSVPLPGRLLQLSERELTLKVVLVSKNLHCFGAIET